MSYRVELPVFSGPLDLLLHLVKQDEVDIHEVSIAGILNRYLAHLDVLENLDLADIGDFLVMASTLMEIKSRELLPKEEVDIEEDLNPRDDLIRRLLEYKRYRDLSRRLERFSARRALMENAGLALPRELQDEADDPELLDIGEIEIWNLTEAFAKLLVETGGDGRMHISVDRRSITYYVARILERIKPQREIGFEAMFDRGEGRLGLIGTFQAMLELMKQGFLSARQEVCFGPIVVTFTGPDTLTADAVADGLTAHGEDGVEAHETEDEAAAVSDGQPLTAE